VRRENMETRDPGKSRLPRGLVPVLLALAAAVSLLVWQARSGRRDDTARKEATYRVQRGPLTISVTESGTIKAREQLIIKNGVEGRTTIISLVPEGTRVQKGDLLVQLDASALEDQKDDQEIRVMNGEAAFVRARENLEVVKNKAASDVDKAELELRFAGEDLKKYVEGEFPQKIMEGQAKVTLAEEELSRAQEKLEWSKVLFDEKYLSQTELQGDELAAKKAELDIELARSDLKLLKSFTYQRELAQLESDVRQNEMALERIRREASADTVQAEADLRAKGSEFEQQQKKLTKIVNQIAKTRIIAPAAGLVVYATSAKASWRGNVEPLDEGQLIHERQELIYLPTGSSFMADVKVHESSLKKISAGLPVRLTVDALPGQTFAGTVAKIAPLPDAQSIFLNPDLKVYRTEVHIDGDGRDLRTGMSCRAEIVIIRYEDALFVPAQAVLRVKGSPTVYVRGQDGWEPRAVKTGLDNNRMVRVTEGLDEGEDVLLTPPLRDAEMSVAEEAPPGPSAPAASGERTETSPVSREEMRKRLEGMSPEEREAAREKYQKMRGGGGEAPGGRRGQ
jgi:HlyD family secretion protein